MTPIIDPDTPMTDDMRMALNWLEARCRIRKITTVDEPYVLGFLRDEFGFANLAAEFTPQMLLDEPQ